MSKLLWIIIFGFLMSAIALVGSLTLVFPHLLVERTLLAMVAFAAGSLLGGAILHMIPAAVEKMGNTTELYVWLISGFVLFLALEQFLMWHHSHTHTHSHSRRPLDASHRHECDHGCRVRIEGEGNKNNKERRTREEVDVEITENPTTIINAEAVNQNDRDNDPTAANHGANDVQSPYQQQKQDKQPMTYLILVADAVHNFMGGLFVGASFMDSVSLGLSAWVAAAAHEIPQELGDFSILLHGGWSRKEALFWNFASALTFVLGGILAYYVSSEHGVNVNFLIPFAAGNFLYIGASDLIPEIKHYHGVGTNLLFFMSFVLGITLLLFIRIAVKGW